MNSEHEQRLAPARARDEFVERLDDRLAQRPGRGARHRGLGDQKRHRDAGHHEQRGQREHGAPRQEVGQDQRQRAGHEARDPVRVDVHRVAESKLGIGQELASVGVEHDVLARREERDCDRDPCDRPQVVRGMEQAQGRDRQEQKHLRHEHPAAPAPEKRQRIAVHQRGPRELPRVRQLDQREEADRLQVDLLGAEPRGQEIEEQVERQSRRESRRDADQHPAIEERLAPRLPRGRCARCRVYHPAASAPPRRYDAPGRRPRSTARGRALRACASRRSLIRRF